MTVPYDPPFLYRTQPYEAAELLNRLQQDSKLPLLIAADFERGLTMRIHGATEFPHAMAFGATGQAGLRRSFRPHQRTGSSRHRRALEFLSRGRRELEPCQPHHQHALFRLRPAAGREPGRCLYPRRARQRNADHGQALPRARRHRDGLPSRSWPASTPIWRICSRSNCRPSARPSRRGRFRHGRARHGACSRARFESRRLHFARHRHRFAQAPTRVPGTGDHRRARHGRSHSSLRLNIGRAAVDAFKAGNDVLLIPADLDASYKALLEAVQSGEIPRDASMRPSLRY